MAIWKIIKVLISHVARETENFVPLVDKLPRESEEALRSLSQKLSQRSGTTFVKASCLFWNEKNAKISKAFHCLLRRGSFQGALKSFFVNLFCVSLAS